MPMGKYARIQTLAFTFLPGETPVRPQSLTLHLHSGDPGDTGANEITDASYQAQPVIFEANQDGDAVSNTAEIVFPAASASYSVPFVTVQDENSNILDAQQLTAARNTLANNSTRFATGELIIGGATQ